jgi:hypothetical protein
MSLQLIKNFENKEQRRECFNLGESKLQKDRENYMTRHFMILLLQKYHYANQTKGNAIDGKDAKCTQNVSQDLEDLSTGGKVILK